MLTIKTLLVALVSWLLSFIMPVMPFLVFTTILVFADLHTGIKAAEFRKEEIRSHGLRRTISKIVLYFIAILLSEGMKMVFHFPSWADVSFLIAGLIAVTEFKSNLENISEYTQKDYWGEIARRLPNVLDWVVPNRKTDIKNDGNTH
jgi:Na+/alanine symporter